MCCITSYNNVIINILTLWPPIDAISGTSATRPISECKIQYDNKLINNNNATRNIYGMKIILTNGIL